MAKKIEIKIGSRFGKWTVVSYRNGNTLSSPRVYAAWNVICDCGKTGCISSYALRHESTKSCRSCAKIKHGLLVSRAKPSPEYQAWSSMHARCRAKHGTIANKHYSGRGIAVCLRWSGSDGFKNFFEDMGERPKDKHSLERLDVNEGYNPSNCVWGTWSEQANNKTNSAWLTYDGITLTSSQWDKRLGFPRGTVSSRLSHNGWTVDEALVLPITRRGALEEILSLREKVASLEKVIQSLKENP